jgi:hypothetical protein
MSFPRPTRDPTIPMGTKNVRMPNRTQGMVIGLTSE